MFRSNPPQICIGFKGPRRAGQDDNLFVQACLNGRPLTLPAGSTYVLFDLPESEDYSHLTWLGFFTRYSQSEEFRLFVMLISSLFITGLWDRPAAPVVDHMMRDLSNKAEQGGEMSEMERFLSPRLPRTVQALEYMRQIFLAIHAAGARYARKYSVKH